MTAKPVISMVIALAMALGMIGVSGTGSAQAKATVFTDNVRVPVNLFVFVPCAAGGAGEFVDLNGTLHFLFRTTVDSGGGFHGKFHSQAQGISGTGLTTGDKYQATGVTQGTFNVKVGSSNTFVNNFRVIGQGPGNNFLVHENFHVTANANSEITAIVYNFRVECKSAVCLEACFGGRSVQFTGLPLSR